jgi:hypothetical protein
LWVRAEESSLYRFVMSLRSGVVAQRAGDLPESRTRLPRLAADSIAGHFRSRARAAGLSPQHYALLWTESRLSYRSGEKKDRTVALIRWEADPEQGVFISWRPDEATLQRYWPDVDEP